MKKKLLGLQVILRSKTVIKYEVKPHINMLNEIKVYFTANLKQFPEKTTQPWTVRGNRGSKVLSDVFHLLKSFERSLKISM